MYDENKEHIYVLSYRLYRGNLNKIGDRLASSMLALFEFQSHLTNRSHIDVSINTGINTDDRGRFIVHL